ncbi:PREDICTED: protein FAM63A-like [Erythranthe guttata]|uniref:protein FAM63A-like n=1 Tax=Erythranthe guttata TaxID=4155 RepID=UPI00064D822A|nr:PREDICTED: protein FAM63A-like [Erythranthe guttata]|eukprot:XP_012835492.1 PREDICTED: protein FAM63A-like [Erythranthe guttata]
MVSPSPSASTTGDPPSPEKLEAEHDKREKEVLHRTKLVQIFGRTTPIFLQRDNGPCLLLAICNVLSLKYSLDFNLDIREVSQDYLLSLVLGLLDSKTGNVVVSFCALFSYLHFFSSYMTDINTFVFPFLINLILSIGRPNKKTGYVQNRQKDIADTIRLLPRLTTGVDMNIKFRRIDDFEFTPESAIFGLLGIPLYHGWIVDPQHNETYAAICSKSYNIRTLELVSLETKSEQKKKLEDDNVDFAAATITSAPVLPSPSPSHRARKGDIEEEAELLRTLELSEAETFTSDLSLGTHLETSEEDFTEESEETGSPISSDCADIYEDAENILDSITLVSENREPVYEGEIIENFMKNSASQLTVYGLFCLLDNVKEGEICVFFRNNRFNTMVKYEGELYILATDQGFIHEPGLVWEKLNEVNGNTVYMTGDFKEFKMSDRSNSPWDAANAMVDTADYPSTIGSAEESSSFDSDLQLAIALQQQEYGDQQQPHSNLQPPAFTDDSSSLVTVPPVSESSDECTKSSKPKEM